MILNEGLKKDVASSYFAEMTGIRAIAAFMVCLHHYNPLRYQPDAGHALNNLLFGSFNEFHVGVSIFFVLSGFLIAFRYAGNFEFTKKWFYRYIQNRIARIYPVYFLLTIITFAVGNYAVKYSFREMWYLLFLNVTFLKGFFVDFKFSGIAQGWTLTVEECFYFSAPVIFYINYKYKKMYLQPVVLMLLGVMLVFVFQRIPFYGFFGSYRFMFLYTFLGRCFEFYAGVSLALFIRKNDEALIKKNGMWWRTFIGVAGIVSCVLTLSLLRTGNYEFGLFNPLGIFINNFILPVFVCCLFYGLLTERSIISKILSTDFFVLLGKSSYVFYLIHIGIFYNFISGLLSSIESEIAVLAIVFILLNLLAIFIYKFVEDPLNRYLKNAVFVKL